MEEMTFEVTITAQPDEGEPSPTPADIASAVENGLAMEDQFPTPWGAVVKRL